VKKKFTINDKPWNWVYRSLRRLRPTTLGLCDWDSSTVTICTSCEGLDRLDTEIHEALHAMQGFASEEHTESVATTIAKILWELGYRLPDTGPERPSRGRR
jgi:hypothetical protein